MIAKWATDVHFDHVVDVESYTPFVRDAAGKLLIVSGDITTARRYDIDLAILSKCAERVLFVCGNHCHWGGSTVQNRKKIVEVLDRYPNTTYLSAYSEPVYIVDNTTQNKSAIVGHDGWYDARVGDPRGVVMNDWLQMGDYGFVRTAYDARAQIDNIIAVSRSLADEGTEHISRLTLQAIAEGCKLVTIVTHVPPYVEAHSHNNAPPDPQWVPWFVNVGLGKALDDIAAKHSDVKLRVLCGHTHGKITYNRSKNVTVHVGEAKYGKPEVQKLVLHV